MIANLILGWLTDRRSQLECIIPVYICVLTLSPLCNVLNSS